MLEGTRLHTIDDSLQLRYFGFEFADAGLHLLRTFDGQRSLGRRGRLSTRERAARASHDDQTILLMRDSPTVSSSGSRVVPFCPELFWICGSYLHRE